METKQGIIESIEIKQGINPSTQQAWTRWAFKIDGKTYSTFDEKIGSNFKAGNLVRITGEQPEGSKYWNMKTMELVTPDEIIETVKIEAPKKDNNTYIVRESALKSSIEACKKGSEEASVQTILELAEAFEKWILR